MTEAFSRYLILVVGNFNRGVDEVLALRGLGVTVLAAGLGSAKIKGQLERHGVGVLGLQRSKRAAQDAAAMRVGGCHAVLFAASAWPKVIESVKEADREAAIADARPPVPWIAQSDPRYRFLRKPSDWALFTLGRAAGGDIETARQFVREVRRGLQEEDTKTSGGARNRPRTSQERRRN